MSICKFENGYSSDFHPYYPKLGKEQILAIARYELLALQAAEKIKSVFLVVLRCLHKLTAFGTLNGIW